VVLCVATDVDLHLFYIIGGQYLVSKLWHLVPISGYDGGLDRDQVPDAAGAHRRDSAASARDTRWYRTIFLEEIKRLRAHGARQGAA
jgi:peptide/nickel transport system permease protein